MSTRSIYIVDDDEAVRSSLFSLLSALPDQLVRSFPSGEAFLERAPAFIAQAARTRHGPSLGSALDHWEAARHLAGGAGILSLDPASVVFELGGHVAALAEAAT